MTDSHDLITERVVATAERLEELVDIDEIDYLDANYVVSSRGDVMEVKVAIVVGGPTIWVNCLNGTIDGYWGGDEHTTHVNSDAVDALGDYLALSFKENMLAQS